MTQEELEELSDLLGDFYVELPEPDDGARYHVSMARHSVDEMLEELEEASDQ